MSVASQNRGKSRGWLMLLLRQSITAQMVTLQKAAGGASAGYGGPIKNFLQTWDFPFTSGKNYDILSGHG
jgi:hypothetical protein